MAPECRSPASTEVEAVLPASQAGDVVMIKGSLARAWHRCWWRYAALRTGRWEVMDVYALVSFSDQIGPLNVFRYITFRTGGATATALMFVFLFGPAIDLLRSGKGPADPRGRPRHAFRHSARRPWAARSVGRHCLDAAVGQPGQLVCGSCCRDAQLRRYRLL
jgi:hypothetical protein